MANDLSFTQVATLLTDVVDQATGHKALTPTDLSSFVNVAQTALKVGYDPILNAINQVLSRTIFSTRPYYRKFRGLETSETRWGNHVRKIVWADKDMDTNNQEYMWPVAYNSGQTPPNGDGQSVDQWVIKKPDILQTNFYGANTISDHITLFRDQLDVAFTGPDQYAQFIAGTMLNWTDKREQYIETIARATLVNLMASVIDEDNGQRVIHLLTQYNTLTGLSLTAQTVYNPTNFVPFMRWVYSKIAQLSSLMTERCELFQTKITGKKIMHHTPYRNQKVYLYAPAKYQISMQVLADTFHPSFLTMADNDDVNFWQSSETPDSISITPVYTDTDGTVKTGDAVAQSKVFGVIFDEEAAGYAITNEWSQATTMNASGGYANIWWHCTFKPYNDITEKAIVLLLD